MFRIMALAGLISVAALAGGNPTNAQSAVTPPTASDTVLFADAFEDIERLYVDPVSIREIALSAATELRGVDSRIGVSDHLAGGAANTLILLYGNREIADFPMPKANDAVGWGSVLAALIPAARAASPALAALRPGQIEDAVLDRVVDGLDRFSRYVGPAAAGEDRAAREGRNAADARNAVSASRDGDILVVRIGSFNGNTTEQAREALTVAQSRRPLIGVVLDLRGNPGGLLDQAVGLADLFVESGPIAATIGRDPASNQSFTASGRIAVASRVGVAVLINGGSASASEIVASALQDSGRAVVVGSSSFGKGTVQTVLPLPNGGELILTWARLTARGGYRLQHHGVVPTLCTALLPDAAAPIAVQMQQAAAVAFAAPRRRVALDDAGWSRLRTSCPPRLTSPPVDRVLAERLLANPELYASALGALPGASP